MNPNKSAPVINLEPMKYNYWVLIFMVWVHGMALIAIPYFTWANFTAFFIMYFVTGCLGITLGFHRLLAHRAMETSKFTRRVFATIGTLALEGSPLTWIGHHRMHHAFSDHDGDPHNAKKGFWYSHLIWLFERNPVCDDPAKIRRFARDIASDPYMMFLDKTWVQLGIQALLGLGFYAIGGIGMVLWAVFLRLVWNYHVTWFVNSAAHKWGYQTYDVGDLARNNWWVALLAWGEGWHNNHHAHGDIALAGHKWWEFDITYRIIQLLALFGVFWDIKGLPESKPAVIKPIFPSGGEFVGKVAEVVVKK